MLWTIVAVLVALWLLGLLGGYAFGGGIHLLLVIIAVLVVFQLLSGRRPLG